MVSSRLDSKWLVFLSVCIVSLLIGLLVYVQLLLPRGPFLWDEAAHGMKGLLIAHDLQTGNLFAFLLDSYRQVLYPPLHSWALSLFFLVLGPSVVTAAAVSLVCFVATSIMLYVASYFLNDHRREVAGVVTASLFLSSPLLISFATQSMQELPGMLALGLLTVVYLKLLRDDPPPSEYVLLGAAIALTYFVRMSYGVLALVVIALDQLLAARFNVRTLFSRKILYILIPVLLAFGVWFAYPAKLFSTWTWLVNYSNTPEPYSLRGWLFYPMATYRLAGSVWRFLALAGSVFVAMLWHRRDGRIRFLLVFLFAQLVIGVLHHNKQDRYMFPLLIPLFLLAGFTFAQWWYLGQRSDHGVRRWLPRVVTVLLLVSAFLLLLRVVDGQPVRAGATDVHSELIGKLIDGDGAALIVGTMDLPDPTPPYLDWYLITQAQMMAAPQAGSVTQIEEERKILDLMTRAPLPSVVTDLFRPALGRYDEPEKTRSMYIGLPRRASYSQTREGFDRFFQDVLENGSFDRVVVVTATGDRAEFPYEYIAPSLQNAGLESVTSQELDSTNVRVDVYR